MRRVVVVGSSGSGKTTVATVLARRLDLPHVELDAMHHGPGWTVRPEFVADADAASGADRWVIDGNYSQVRDLLWSRADTVVWLDLPRLLVEWQVVTRSIARAVDRRPLWNGNRERPSTWLRASHPIRWSWSKHPTYRQAYVERFSDPAYQHLLRVRLTSRAQIRRFLDTATPS